jgi:CBS domain-containing protein
MVVLEKAFSVKHIATFSLTTVTMEDPATPVLQAYPVFDQFPVEVDGKVVGVLERKPGIGRKQVKDVIRWLDDSLLIAAEEPLVNFIRLIADPPYYRLVLQGSKITGIVTRSDLIKLPVRLLIFARLTYLEMIMAEIINTRCPDEADWMALLSEHRRLAVMKEQHRHQRDKSDLPLLEMTSILDKGDIVQKLLGLDDSFPHDLDEMRKLRNKVAHGSQFGERKVQVIPFIAMISKMDGWITELGSYYSRG